MSDRFSADEARRIFARAARRQHAAPTPDGLTVDDLAEIGREAGLDPALVAAEAAAERLGTDDMQTWHGVPLGIRRSRLMPARVSDAEWERVVDRLRAEFKVIGVTEQIGRRREWATMASTSAAYRVRVEAQPDGDLVTVEAPNISHQLGIGLAASLGGGGVVTALLVGLIVRDARMGASIGGVMLVVALVTYLVSWLASKAAAPRTSARVDTVLDRIDLLSRTDAPVPRLDPALLDPDAEAAPEAAPRRRARA